MKRAKQLGSVVFENNTLFIQEEFNNDSVMGEMVMSAAGSHIVYEAEISTPYITLDSKEHGWLSEAQCDILIGMRQQLETTFTLTYDDATTDEVRIAKEKKMVFTPLFEGSCDYVAVIPLAKVS